MNDKEFVEKMNYFEWKKQIEELHKKFDECEKNKKGKGVL